ncbi:alpha/beta hydrolase (plasmid) [Hymenobacter sp. BRD128]|uniref:alpha/beta fold hydrolase n=1 Tax=Hymenobacter sp. BRD128 TaxID=2675878 RepID=UPI001564DEBC|nr:alpha/beta hydrolase [Hymenobacter sp. BRD128]QKG59229.1 alpha/beta hydrolase [Hymenobacter sp. BRD128]
MRILKKAGRIVLLLVLLAVGIGVLYEQVERLRARRTYPLTGRLLPVGDHRLHYLATAPRGPVVVFESGLDLGGLLPWERVVAQVAPFVTAFAYDRAGIQRSERGTRPTTGAAMARDLHELLHRAGYPPPYLLVGHSLGGILLRSFVAQYPAEVCGVVLVEASHPDQLRRLPAALPADDAPPRWVVRLAAAAGVVRFLNTSQYAGTRPNDRINLVNRAFLPESVDAVLEEQAQIPALLDEARPVMSFGDIPLRVVTGTSPTRDQEDEPDAARRRQINRAWGAMQQDQLRLSTRSAQLLAPQSGHYVQLEQPDIVTAAIKQVLAQSAVPSYVPKRSAQARNNQVVTAR